MDPIEAKSNAMDGTGKDYYQSGAFEGRMPIVYQCYTCGRRHKTEQAALDCHEGPIQAIETKVKRDVYRAFYGNMIRKDKKK